MYCGTCSSFLATNMPAMYICPSVHMQGNSKEEVRCLQHRVRVLEKALDTQTKLTQEYYQDLLQKAEEYEELGMWHNYHFKQ